MRRPWLQWTIAIVVTLVSAIYQRRTGPTYPARGDVTIAGETVKLRLLRTNSITSRMPVTIKTVDPSITASAVWRKYPTNDAWQTLPLTRAGDSLTTLLPPEPVALMPMAGKLEYKVQLAKGADTVTFPSVAAIARFKGDVPLYILIPHVMCMFFGMLFAMRAMMAAVGGGDTRRWSFITIGLLFFGGFGLGPLVQKYAFDAYWTGFPFGFDLTDNKTLIAGIAWGLAWLRLRGGKQAKVAVVVATLVTMIVFAIPHSMWGSQAKW